ncbi:hypothetical protein J2S49_001209 [Arcanobacterium wilhelmae]|uniref:Ribbon-helix-helix protein CopG domain-containing protein n=1 Tax=Arcanobacterium wilhelmae TaxID=1803177 RepID=A0ABT9NBQ2_9ACTO|nr:CopG family transcriptional regulator [Arcanobacterium wilhelmae]MDP9801133.1 hypothetical protein [Arcanobacterium wilhelmae]WFN90486.1 ribbon-helix-helix domain-containing protein [Arcanobacterium wilhelmae]
MNVKDFMEKHGLSDQDLDQMAASYEAGDYPTSGNRVYVGSHLSAVGMKRVTVAYPASDAQEVKEIARARGVSASDIYRTALAHYLAESDIA